MKVALVGYGKMGKEIEQILQDRNHEVVARIQKENSADIQDLNSRCDLAIEFSTPEAVFSNFKTLLEQNIPIVTGTTGWYEHFDELKEIVSRNKGSFFYATNFSLGVNLFFELNRKLASMMKNYPAYRVSMDETHHTQKLDAPSGTAISLAEGILQENPKLNTWELGKALDNQIQIDAHRIEGVPGTHEVHYRSTIDDIDIKHTAHSRKGFAMGAVLAAEFLQSKKGIYSMSDLLKSQE
mgnify:CR=1 FL=1